MKKKLIFVLLLIGMAFISCSTTEVTKTEETTSKVVLKRVNEVKISIDQNNCWINSMPGSEPKFHISGKFSLLPNDNYEIENTKLSFIKVYQNENEFYFIKPTVVENFTENIMEITYSTIKGLSVNKDLNKKNEIVLELIFKSKNADLKYYIENVKIEEVF